MSENIVFENDKWCLSAGFYLEKPRAEAEYQEPNLDSQGKKPSILVLNKQTNSQHIVYCDDITDEFSAGKLECVTLNGKTSNNRKNKQRNDLWDTFPSDIASGILFFLTDHMKDNGLSFSSDAWKKNIQEKWGAWLFR